MFLQDEDDEDQNCNSQWGTVYNTANRKGKKKKNKIKKRCEQKEAHQYQTEDLYPC